MIKDFVAKGKRTGEYFGEVVLLKTLPGDIYTSKNLLCQRWEKIDADAGIQDSGIDIISKYRLLHICSQFCI